MNPFTDPSIAWEQSRPAWAAEATWDGVEQDPIANPRAVDAIDAWAKTAGARVLLLAGKPGTGKTWIATALAARALAAGIPALFVRMSTLLRTPTWGVDGDQWKAWERVGLLVIDDLGSSGPLRDHDQSVADHIMNIRADRGLRTILTTNAKPGEHLTGLVGKRLASRLEQWTVVVVDGPDRRVHGGGRSRAQGPDTRQKAG